MGSVKSFSASSISSFCFSLSLIIGLANQAHYEKTKGKETNTKASYPECARCSRKPGHEYY